MAIELKPVPHPVSEGLVKCLESILEDAKKGEVVGCVVCLQLVGSDTQTSIYVSHTAGDAYAMNWALDQAKRRLLAGEFGS